MNLKNNNENKNGWMDGNTVEFKERRKGYYYTMKLQVKFELFLEFKEKP